MSSHPGDFWTTSYSEIFEYFGIICIFQIWLTLYPNLTFTPIFPYFLFLPILQPNPSPDPSSNTQNFQTRVKSQNLPRWLSCDIKTTISSPRGLLEKPHILKDLSFLVKFVFFKSDLFWTQIWILPRFSPISGFYQNCNQIVPRPLFKQSIFWN